MAGKGKIDNRPRAQSMKHSNGIYWRQPQFIHLGNSVHWHLICELRMFVFSILDSDFWDITVNGWSWIMNWLCIWLYLDFFLKTLPSFAFSHFVISKNNEKKMNKSICPTEVKEAKEHKYFQKISFSSTTDRRRWCVFPFSFISTIRYCLTNSFDLFIDSFFCLNLLFLCYILCSITFCFIIRLRRRCFLWAQPFGSCCRFWTSAETLCWRWKWNISFGNVFLSLRLRLSSDVRTMEQIDEFFECHSCFEFFSVDIFCLKKHHLEKCWMTSIFIQIHAEMK